MLLRAEIENSNRDGLMVLHRASTRPRETHRAAATFLRGAIRAGGCVGLALCLLLTGVTVPTQAQEWWEGITSFGTPDYTGRRAKQRERTARAKEPLNDLRDGPIPWRSDEMIAAMGTAIERYQFIVSKGGWPAVPPGRMMRIGEEDDRVPILRQRLRISGDLSPRNQSYNSYTYDEELAAAVRRFQRRHGLRPTGRVERSTYPTLNVSAAERLAQLRLNLGRIRNLMRDVSEPRYILVNVPAFQLEAVERFEVRQRHRVIVGKQGRDTPSVKATIRAVNFFPYWNVPESVANLDLIPRLAKEPDYLQKEKIRVLNGYNGPELDPFTINWGASDTQKLKFRQDPGPQNALGLVRIDMPNEHTVYMHDTPMKTLFDQRSRAFSAGCVRVQDVFKLVEWIAQYEPGWERPGRAQEILQNGEAVDITLTRPLPVYFAYITAWAERNGTVEFRPDIYGRDGSVDTVAAMDRDPADPPPPPTLAP